MAVVSRAGFRRGPHAGSPRGGKEVIRTMSMLALLCSANSVYAQHEGSGGSTPDVVGGSITANVRSARAPAKQPARPTTAARRRSPSTSKARRMDADDYYEQGTST